MSAPLRVGGAPLITLQAKGEGPGLTRAVIAPGRAMMLLSLTARRASGEEIEVIERPPLDEAAARLNDQSGPFPGNTAFAFGGAVLAPFANRIRGRLNGDEILADLPAGPVRLPANWSGQTPGAERYAMHGLILNQTARQVTASPDGACGQVRLDQPAHWPGSLDFSIGWRLSPKRLSLTVVATNTGAAPSPMGIGWHPYFRIPSGDRGQARLHVPAASRALVGDYDAVLPTGAVEAVAGTAYDFRAVEGRALGEQYLDDCFLDLAAERGGKAVARLIDPAASYELTVSAKAPPVRAFQVYAPTVRPVVALEPQFNLADPFSSAWRGRETGMVKLISGGSTRYETAVLVKIGDPARTP